MIDIVVGVRSTEQYRTIDYFSKLLTTLKEHTKEYRLIVVDDWSDPLHRVAIEDIAHYHNAWTNSSILIKTFKQRWFTRAYNIGLRLVRTPWVVMLNVDVELGAGWLDELFIVKTEVESQYNNEVMARKVGLVGSEFSAEEPRRWQNITSPSTPGNPGYCTGHCWLANMQALYEASAARGTPGIYLDETQHKTIHIYSDNEISYNLQNLGWLTVRSFKSAVGHHGGKSWGHDLSKPFGTTLEQVNDTY